MLNLALSSELRRLACQKPVSLANLYLYSCGLRRPSLSTAHDSCQFILFPYSELRRPSLSTACESCQVMFIFLVNFADLVCQASTARESCQFILIFLLNCVDIACQQPVSLSNLY